MISRCYLCQKPVVRFLEKNGYTLYRCAGCGLGMTELKKDYKSFLTSFYTEGYFNGDPSAGAYKNYGDDKAYIQKNLMQILSRIQKKKPTGTLLDVGSAYGYFVELAISKGYDAWGVEPSKHALTRVSQGIKKRIVPGTVNTLSFPKKTFDVITLFDVVEHMAHPKKDLKILCGFLKDDGILVIATGDTGSLAAKLLGRRWTFYIPPQHLFFFSRTNLTALLSKAGFQAASWFRVGKWLRLSYILHLARTGGESSIARSIGKFVERLGLGNIPLYLPMGDNIVVIAKKSTYDAGR